MQNSADQHSLIYDLQEPCYYAVLDIDPDARCAIDQCALLLLRETRRRSRVRRILNLHIAVRLQS